MWDTFANIVGSLLVGMVLGFNLNESYKLGFITGFLGSFTTFSAFSAEFSQKWLNGDAREGLLIFLLHTVGGISATLFGLWLTKR